MRLLQGLALGGEYGGAATYVAEHAPMGKRGYYTSFIQTTATLGLFLSLLVILFTRTALGEADFAAWGWRIPFLVSVVLLGISVWIRLRLNESPVFQKMKDEGKSSKAPLTEAFANWSNAKIVLLALFGGVMGQGVVWYTGQFYALFFLQSILKVDGYTANLLIAWSLLLGTGFFIVFGALSDKIGRKPIILAGCLIAALTFFPIFRMITTNANPALEKAIETVKVEVVADPKGCGDLFNPVGTRVFTAPCDTARAYLAQSVGQVLDQLRRGRLRREGRRQRQGRALHGRQDHPTRRCWRRSQAAGYPKAGDAQIVKMSHPFDIFRPQVAAVIGLLFILVIFVTMVYGPIAAMLVELFPTKIRYTSMSLPYHIGNGWFGGSVARDRVRDRGFDRRYLCRSLVPDHLRIDHRGRRLLLPAGDQGRRYHEVTDFVRRQPPDDHKTNRPRSDPRPVLFWLQRDQVAPMNCSTISRRCGRARCSIR